MEINTPGCFPAVKCRAACSCHILGIIRSSSLASTTLAVRFALRTQLDSWFWSFPQLNCAYHRARDVEAQGVLALHVLLLRTDWVVDSALHSVWCCLSGADW